MIKLILVGKGASGKDYYRKKLEEKGGIYGISCTSRQPREGEINGKDYNFFSKEEFEQKIQNGDFIQYCEFNGSYYGTSKETFESSDIFIMSPEGIGKLPKEIRERCTVIFISASYNKRINRMKNRSNNTLSEEEIMKRIEEDDKLFSGFSDFDLVIENN